MSDGGSRLKKSGIVKGTEAQDKRECVCVCMCAAIRNSNSMPSKWNNLTRILLHEIFMWKSAGRKVLFHRREEVSFEHRNRFEFYRQTSWLLNLASRDWSHHRFSIFSYVSEATKRIFKQHWPLLRFMFRALAKKKTKMKLKLDDRRRPTTMSRAPLSHWLKYLIDKLWNWIKLRSMQ